MTSSPDGLRTIVTGPAEVGIEEPDVSLEFALAAAVDSAGVEEFLVLVRRKGDLPSRIVGASGSDGRWLHLEPVERRALGAGRVLETVAARVSRAHIERDRGRVSFRCSAPREPFATEFPEAYLSGFLRRVDEVAGQIAAEHPVEAPAAVLLVADPNRGRIVEIDTHGVVRRAFDGFPDVVDVEWLADGGFLVTQRALGRVAEVSARGAVVREWSGSLDQPTDADRLRDGHVLVADAGGFVVELDRDGAVVWRFEAPGLVPADAERRPNGNTLIADRGLGRILEVGPSGAIQLEIGGFANVSDVDPLPDGRLLVTQGGPDRVVELEPGGSILWVLDGVLEPVDADRLRNGRTLVVERDRVREFARDGRAVAEFAVEGAAEANKY